MRLAIFSDIHGNYQALDSILNDIEKKNIDKIIFLGDAIGLGPSSNECINRMNKLDNFVFISGNHELYYTKSLDKNHIINENFLKYNKWLHKRLNCKIDDSILDYKINYKDKTLYFTHYFQVDEEYPFLDCNIYKNNTYKEQFDKYKYDYMFFGHVHDGRYDKYKNRNYYCIGSSGCTKDDNTFYYIIDLNDKINIEKIDLKYDRSSFEKELDNIKFPNKEHICEYFFGIKKC